MTQVVQKWIAKVGSKTVSIEKDSPRETGWIESFNPKLRDELVDWEIFHSLRVAQILIETRPHSALGCRAGVHIGPTSPC